MKQDNTTYIRVSPIDPLETLLNTVIGISTSDGFTIRGRLIKIDDRVLWLKKMSEDVVMVARADVTRIWRSHDCKVTAVA